MYKLSLLYVRLIESLSKTLGHILKGTVLIIIFILLFETVSRYIFDKPTNWSIELGQFLLGAYAMLGGAYVLLHERHVRMDALYSRWSAKGKAIADIATFPLIALYLAVIIIGGIHESSYALKFGQHSNSMWSPPLAPIKITVVVGVSILLLQSLALFIRSLLAVKGKDLP